MKKFLLLFPALFIFLFSVGQNTAIQKLSGFSLFSSPGAPLTGGAGPITGDGVVCRLTTGHIYSIDPIPGATSYVWSVPPQASISGGQGTTSITVDFPAGSISGLVIVYGLENGVPGAPSSLPVTVLGPIISGNNHVCKLAVETYTTEAAKANYIWAFNGAQKLGGGGVADNWIQVKWIASGARYVRATYTDGTCTSTTTYNVEVDNSSPTLSGSSASCYNATELYHTDAGMVPGSYVWTVSPGNTYTGGGPNDNTINITWKVTGLQWVTVNYTSSLGCTITPTTVNVQVWALPVPNLNGSTGPFCAGTTQTYTTDAGKKNYIWTVSPGNPYTGGGINSNSITVTWNSPGPQTISVNYTDNHGSYWLCSAATPTTKTVNVNALPVPTITGPASICGAPAAGKHYTTEVGMINYVWTVPPQGTIVGGGNGFNFVDIDWTVTGTYTIGVTYTDGNLCSPAAPTTKIINIYPLPTPTITGPTPVCVNSTGNLYITEPGQNNYNWVLSPGGVKTAGGGLTDNTITVTWTTSGAHSVSVNYANAFGCFALASFEFPVEVQPPVGVPVFALGATSSRCQGAEVVTYTATAAGSTGITYQLDAASLLGGNTIDAGTGAVTYTAGWFGTSVITAIAAGCEGPKSATHTVTIFQTPVANPVADQTYCNNDNAPQTVLTGLLPGTTFTWANNNTAIGLGANGSGNVPSFTATNITNAPISGVITVTPTANGCTGPSITYTIVVNPTPTVDPITDQTYCNGDAALQTLVTGPVAGSTFAWTNSNTSIGLAASGNGNIPSFTATNATSAPISGVVTITPTANGCTGTTATYTIIVNPTPSVNPIADQTYCNGVVAPQTTITGPVAGSTFSWTNSNPAIGLAANGNGNVPSFTATNPTNATISGLITISVVANGCNGPSVSYTIFVDPTPTVDPIADQTYCNGDVAPVTPVTGPVAGSTFTWTNSNTAIGLAASGAGDIPSFIATNVTTAPISGIVTITPVANGCTGPTLSYMITVNPTPTVDPIADQAYCNGQVAPSTVLSGPVAGSTFSWTNSNPAIGLAAGGNGDVPSFNATNPTTAPISGLITVSVLANGCAGPSITYTIVVNPTPTADPVADQTYCNGDVAPLTVLNGPVAGTTFSWTNSNTAIGLAAGGTGNIPSFTATNLTNAPISGIITITPSANGCTGPTISYTVTVNPTPTINPIADQTYCNGDIAPATVISGPVAGSTFSWTNSNPAIGLGAGGAGDVPSFTATNPTNAPISGLITVSVVANGCTGPSITYTIIVNPTPSVDPIADQTYCNGDLAPQTILSGPVAGSTFSWTNNNTAIGLGASGNGNVPSFTATNITSAPISATITVSVVANGCPGVSASYNIIVNPTPTVDPIADQTYCNGDVAPPTVISGPVAGSIFSWTNSNPAIGLAASGNGDVPSFTATNPTTAPISAVISIIASANGCTGPATSYTIIVNPTPTVNPIADQTYCNGDIAPQTILSGPVAGSTFSWTNNNTAIGLGAGGNGDVPSFAATNLTNAPISAVVTVSVIANGCPGPSISYNIVVNPTPTVNPIANQTYCNGDVAPPTVLSGPVAGSTFTWTNSNPAIGLAASGTGDVPSFTATNPTAAPISALITVSVVANDCPGPSTTYTITVNPTPTVNPIADQTYCNGDLAPVTVVSGPVAGTIFFWTNSNPAIGLAPSGTGDIPSFIATNPTFAPISAVITIAPVANGCAGPPVTYTITVNPTPIVIPVPDQAYCNGDFAPPTILISPVAGSTFTWTNSNPAIGLPAGGTGNVPPFFAMNPTNAPISGLVTVYATANGCTGPAMTYTIVVNPTPTVNPIADQTYCNGDIAPLTMVTGPVAGTIFFWTNSNPAIGLAPSGMGDIPSFIATNGTIAPISGLITIAPLANGCPGPVTTYTITVYPTATVNPVPNAVYCNGNVTSPITFSSPVAGTTYTWTNNNTTIGLPANGIGNIASFIATNSGTAPVVATITVTPSANGCTGIPITFTITVNPTATVNPVSNVAYCNGATTTAIVLSGPVAGTTFTWTNDTPSIGLPSGGVGDIPSFVATNVGIVPVVATITVTPTANSCVGTPFSFTITVNPTPTADPVSNVAYCNGATTATIIFSGPVAGTSYAWTNSAPSIGLPASGNGNIPPFVATNAGTAPVVATITVTPSANGCSGTPITFTITVNPTPTVTPVSDYVYCNGASTTPIVFSGPVAGTSFAWTNNTPSIGLPAFGNGNIGTFTATNTGTAPVVATITVTPTANGCTGPAITFTITVNPTPTVNPVSNFVYCNGAATTPINFGSPVAGTTYAWTNSAPSIGLGASGSGNIGSFTATNAGTTPVVATITVTPTANGCTGPSITFTITVNPTPTVSPVSNSVYCNGTPTAPITFNGAVAGTTYAWTNSAPSIGLPASGSGNIPSFIATNITPLPVIATITVTPSANGCSGNPITFTITVNPTPTLTSTLTPPPVCNNTVFSYTPTSGTPGTTFAWTRAAVAGISNPAANGTGNPNETLVNTTVNPIPVTYVYTLTANGCTNSTTYNVVVVVNPTPTLTSTLTPPPICNNTVFSYTPTSGTAGTTFAWSRALVAGISNPAANGTGNPNETLNNTTPNPVSVTYVYTLTANGCTNPATYSVVVVVNPTPVLTSTLTPPPICSNSVFSYTPTSSTAGTSFAWTRAVVAGISNPAGSGTGNPNETLINTTSSPVNVTYVYTLSANGCTNPTTYNVVVTVNPLPVPTIAGYTSMCVNIGPLNYTTEPGMTGYFWEVSPGNILGPGQGTNMVSITWTVPGTQWVKVTYTNAFGCNPVAPTQLFITVGPLPAAAGTITGTSAVCGGTTGVTYSVAPIADATTYMWDLPAGAVIASGDGTNVITVDFGLFASSGDITVYGNNLCGNGAVSPPFAVTVTPIPDTAGVITGDTAVCQGVSGVVYSVPPIANATTGYFWTLPNGATIVAGDNTNTITVNFDLTAVSGYISVYGINSCGNGAVGPLFHVTVNPIPPAPVITDMGGVLHSSAPAGNLWYFQGAPAPPPNNLQDYTPTASGIYWCVVSLNGCTSDTSNHIDFWMVGIQPEPTAADFVVYPVPNDGQFRVSINSPSPETFNIRIYNNLGVMIKEISKVEVNGTAERSIDLRPTPSGIYTVILENGNKRMIKKILISR